MFRPKPPTNFFSIPNIITLCRLGLSLSFFVLAIQKMNPTYNFIGLGIHWFGDLLDGWYARTFKQETIVGAEIDLIADRVEVVFFYAIFLMFNPNLYLPIVIYLIDYAFVDFYLGYQFNKFDIISPNYFYKVDKTVYALNFSNIGKFCNSTLITLLLIFFPQIQLVTAFLAAVLIGIKSYSIHLLNMKKIIGKKESPIRTQEMYR